MKLHPDQNEPAAPMRLGDTPIDEREVIAAIAMASDDENPTTMECVTADLLLMSFLPESESYIQHITETGQAVTKPEFIGASNVMAMMADESDNIISLDYQQ
nr:MAG: hypothetical protein [Bacteriophage sp.]